jgi:hypothetical protein
VTYRLLYPCPLYCVYVYYSNQHYRALEAFLSIYTLSDENQMLHPEMVQLYNTYSVYLNPSCLALAQGSLNLVRIIQ